MIKIKPCPFCGNKEPKYFKMWGYNAKTICGHHIVCEPDESMCGAHGPITNSKATAIKKWNLRKFK